MAGYVNKSHIAMMPFLSWVETAFFAYKSE